MKPAPNDPRHAEAAFYAAFGRRDLAAMTAIWSDSPQALCIHPGGPPLHGPEAILQSWTEILGNAAPPEVRYRELQQLLSGDLAIHIVEELIRPAGSSDAATRVIATNVYQRAADDGWRLLVHHASLPLMRGGGDKARSLH
jgi:ketosteroid isomerase-like protein